MDETKQAGKRASRATAGTVSSGDLTTAYRIAANLVADHGDTYLPLFERLDLEITARDERRAILDRAAEVAKQAPGHARDDSQSPS